MPAGRPLPRARLLDVRPLSEAVARPIRDAACVPLDELPGRLHELPSPGEALHVADTGEEAQRAIDWLRGRHAQLAPFAWDDEPWRPRRLWEPNPLLGHAASILRTGRALDLACGSGRDAVYLASAGWQVTAVDVLEDALERGRHTAERSLGPEDGEVRFVHADLAVADPPFDFAPDLVLMFLFLDRGALLSSLRALRPGGSVLIETFSAAHREHTGKPKSPSLVLTLAEALAWVEGWHIHVAEEGPRTVRLWAQKPESSSSD